MAGGAKIGLLAVGLVAISVAGSEPPRPIPRDNLPEKLSVTDIPAGLPAERPIPGDNPLTPVRVQLGRKLFFDPILSDDRTVACATCHDPRHGFASREPRAIGVRDKKGPRNAPSLWNRAYGTSFFWDGREASLEAQALRPIEDPNEMASSLAATVKRLREHPDYPARFQAAFGEGVSASNLARALASFERTLLLGSSRIDRFRAGDVAALTETERHGLWLWESKGGCWNCHSGPNFTDERFHNTGVSWGKEPLDLGRFAVTKQDADRGKFRTPTLRGVAWTAPYMHDGSIATLEEVIEFYNRGGTRNPNLDSALQPLGLTRQEVQGLTAFLQALSEGGRFTDDRP